MILKILISVLTYNGGEKTIRTLSDLASQRLRCPENYQITIVMIDNFSINGIADVIAKKFQSVKIVKLQENSGFSGGNNVAIDLAVDGQYDCLFVLNDDLRLDVSYVQNMLEAIQALPNTTAAIGSSVVLTNGVVQAVSGRLKWWSAGVAWSKDRSIPGGLQEVDVVQGAAFVLTKQAIQSGFRFDDCLFFGGEEHDLGCWARRAGLKIFVSEKVDVIHDTNQMRLIIERWYGDDISYYYAVRNSLYVTKKYRRSKLKFVIAISYFLSRSIGKGLIFLLRGQSSVLTSIIKGAYDGIFERMGQYRK